MEIDLSVKVATEMSVFEDFSCVTWENSFDKGMSFPGTVTLVISGF